MQTGGAIRVIMGNYAELREMMGDEVLKRVQHNTASH